MRNRLLVGLACAVGLAALPGVSVYAKKKDAAGARLFFKQLPKDEKVLQALNRLTFGPRPGDAARVRAMGLKKWIDLQLHPESIPENPVLEAKLKTLDTLRMSSEELVRNYPTPQMVQQMVAGRCRSPPTPSRRLMIEKLACAPSASRATRRPERARHHSRSRTCSRPRRSAACAPGTPQQRLAAFQALPAEKQDDVIAALPAGIRQALFADGPARAAAQNRAGHRPAAGGGARPARKASCCAPSTATASSKKSSPISGSTTSTSIWTKAPTATWSPNTSATSSARTCSASSATCWKPPPRARRCCSTWTTGSPSVPTRPQPRGHANAAAPRPQRKLRPRAAGAAHAGRGRRLHAEGRHRSGALLHRLDHQPAAARRRLRVQPAAARQRRKDRARRDDSGRRRHGGRREGARHPGAPSLHRALHFARSWRSASWPTIRRHRWWTAWRRPSSRPTATCAR